MQRFLFVVAAVLTLAIGSGEAALAGTKWCVVDPVLTVDGRTSDVTLAFDQSNVKAVSPPVVFRFHVPANASAGVTMPPADVTYTVEILYDLPARLRRDPVTVTVETLVPATAVFAVETVVHLPRGVAFSATGVSGSITTISYTVR
jgi:hypothetical protein